MPPPDGEAPPGGVSTDPEAGAGAAVASKPEAQRRVDRVLAFRAELEALAAEGVAVPERARIDAHHDRLLAGLAERFDVDVTAGQKGLSRGMRIAAFLGALALAASVVLLFYRIWGTLSTPVQVLVLVAAPLLALAATELAARRDRSGDFATLAALTAFAAFVLNVSALGQIFAVVPSDTAFLAFAAFAFALAYGYGLRLLLVAAIASFVSFLAMSTCAWSGVHWPQFGERPETFLPAGLLLCAVPDLVAHRRLASFEPVYRASGLLTLLLPVLVLSFWGEGSFLPFRAEVVEAVYQIAGFVLAAAAIGIGIRRRWTEWVHLGTLFFVLFLWTKLVDWFWDWMPKYLFFLIVGATAVAALLALQRLRHAAPRSSEETA